MSNMKTTKTSEVLQHLQNKGSITSWEAIQLYSATRLSAIIFNLKKRGYDISSNAKAFVDCNGHPSTFAVYTLNKAS